MVLPSEMGWFANDEMPEQVTVDPSQPVQPVHLVASFAPHTTQSTFVDARANGARHTAAAATTASGACRGAEPRAPPPSAVTPATSQPARSTHAATAAPTGTRR